jgi:aminopeptidase N
MISDSLETSHPVSVEVNDPSEINAIFDTISYDKGASIIRMMNAFLSENTFRKGVSVRFVNSINLMLLYL